jgi:hydrogenase 3 maturation protease
MIDLPSPRPTRIAIVGVGNELNGDDGAGPRVVKRLAARLPATPGLLLIDAGLAPENFTGPLRRFKPELVLEVDAADQGAAPGAVGWVDWESADGLSASTHTLPPSVFASYLVAELGCRVALIGIQPADLSLNAPLSPAVDRACTRLVEALSSWLASEAGPKT